MKQVICILSILVVSLAVFGSLVAAQSVKIVGTVAGSSISNGVIAGFSGDGGPATQALLREPEGMVFDPAGNLYIVDVGNQRIRKISTNGIISTFAGNGSAGYAGDGGPATSARLYSPSGIAVDANGNVYIADRENNCVRRVSADGVISRFAGLGGERNFGFSGDGGLATQARFDLPSSITVDRNGNVFVVDEWNHRIRKIGINGIVNTIAGSGLSEDKGGGFSGDGGPATQALLNIPRGVVVGSDGSIYIADQNNDRIRKVDVNGLITTFAGTGLNSLNARGNENGWPPTQTNLTSPTAVAFATNGDLYIADSGMNRIRKITDADFSFSVSPPEVTLQQGSRVTLQFSINRINNFIGEADIRPGSGLPQGITGSYTGLPDFASSGDIFFIASDNAAVGGPFSVTVNCTIWSTTRSNAIVGITRGTVVRLFVTQGSVSPPVITQPPVATQPPPSSGIFAVDFTVTNTAGQLNPEQGGFTVRFTLKLTNQPPLRSFKWDFGDGTTSKDPHPEHTYSAAGVYTVTVAITTEAGEVITKTKEKFITVTSPIPVPRLEPKIYVSRGSLDFRSDGITRIGIAVMNSGTAPLEITKIVIGGRDSLDFSVSPTNLMIEVEKPGPQNNVGKVSIVFTPQTAGEKRARLFLYHNAPNSPAVVELRGTSVVIPEVKPSPDFDGDGRVDFNDFWPFLDVFGSKTTVLTVKFDLDQNGEIGFGDFFIFVNAFGKEIK